MPEWLNTKKIAGFNAIELSLLLTVVSMPFSNNLNSYFIVVFCITALFSNSLKEKGDRLRHNKLWILPLIYFVWMTISYIWDSSPDKSLGFLEKKISLIAFPILLASTRPLNKNALRRIFLSFVVANILGAFYCLWQAYLAYIETDYINFFFYHHLSMHIGINAIYFSLYCVFSILILFYYAYFQKSSTWFQLISAMAIIFLTVFTVFLASKMLIFLLFLSILTVVVYSIIYFKKVKVGFLLTLLLLFALPFLLLEIPYVSSRISDTKFLEYRNAMDNYNGMAVRGLLWKASWNLIKENPLVGHGHSGAEAALRQEYIKAGFEVGAKENFNSHNQYLYSWVKFGIIGLLAILSYFLLFVKKAFKQRNLLAALLGVLFIIANITECMLEGQKGIVFFTLFSSLFLFQLFTPHVMKENAA